MEVTTENLAWLTNFYMENYTCIILHSTTLCIYTYTRAVSFYSRVPATLDPVPLHFIDH